MARGREEKGNIHGNSPIPFKPHVESYLLSFVKRLATTPVSSRPTSISGFKALYCVYREEHPVKGLSPSTCVYYCKAHFKVIRRRGPHYIIYMTRSLSDYAPVEGQVVIENGVTSTVTRADLDLINKNRDELEKDKFGVSISNVMEDIAAKLSEFGLLLGHFQDTYYISPSNDLVFSIRIYVRSRRSQTAVKPPFLLLPDPSLDLDIGDYASGLYFPPNHSKTLKLKIHPKAVGYMKNAIVFQFSDFTIVKYITIKVTNNQFVEELMVHSNVKMSRKLKPINTHVASEIIRGIPPPMPKLEMFKNRIPFFDVPNEIEKKLRTGFYEEKESEFSMKNLKQLCSSFHTLYYIEELQMRMDIRRYDMTDVTFQKVRAGYLLQVPGLAEKRPSVVYGDRIYASIPEKPDLEYEGYVHLVQKEEILVKFKESFSRIEFNSFNVRFTFNRLPIRRCHQALDNLLEIPESLCFPRPVPARETQSFHVPIRIPSNSVLNHEQERAVKNMIACPHRGVPYLIYGPPGTGKTRTLVEGIFQIYNHNKYAPYKYLCLAPSNAACDQFIQRLSKVFPPSEMYRLNAYTRDKADLVPEVEKYSSYDKKTNTFELLPLEKILKYKVVVCTMISANYLHGLGVPRGNFTHFMIDEAGQATEPEIWIGLSSLISEDPDESQVVVAGDPKQLGPVIRSQISKKYGLAKSYLERIHELPVYANAKHSNVMTTLVKNYRSHPAILELPSRLFYKGELEPFADKMMRETFVNWKELPNSEGNFPIIFYGMNGQDMRENDSPSWYNPDEIKIVKSYVELLLRERRYGVSASDIGIIAPYRKQVQRLRMNLNQYQPQLKIGSVEEFQGQERKVIIITTVRSNPSNINHDLSFNLGFLKNPKRFNVAITRAKALLIVVGNPLILEADPHWGAFIRYCRTNKAITNWDPRAESSSSKKSSKQDVDAAIMSMISTLSKSRMLDGAEDEDVSHYDNMKYGLVTAMEDPEWEGDK